MVELFMNHQRIVEQSTTIRLSGRVSEVAGLTVVADGLVLPVGSLCEVDRKSYEPLPAQVVGAKNDRVVLMPLFEPVGVTVGDRVTSRAGLQYVGVGSDMLGTVLNALGRAIGGKREYSVEAQYPVFREPPPALSRVSINEPLGTGIRSIDALTTLGQGQRVGIFAATGVGKSVLMSMIARATQADVTVFALVGERGREVGDFLYKDLSDEARARSVMVVSTSDESAVLRMRAAFVATAIAEYFRDLGKNVLLFMDSVTRVAQAQRQIGLSAGEPPTTKGYPPSVFALLPKLLERSGRTAVGSITGLYTVLVEGDDPNEPIADAIRGVLDGHVSLSRDLANRSHYPAVAVLESVSRLMPDVADAEHLRAASIVRRVLAVWHDIEDLVNVGAYAAGVNVDFDVAVRMKPVIDAFLQQGMEDRSDMAAARENLLALAAGIETCRRELSRKVGPEKPAGPARTNAQK